MPDSKERESLILNLVMLVLAVGAFAVAVWGLLTYELKSGIDDLFLVAVCLLLAFMFGVSPAMYAYSKGWVRNPFKRRGKEKPAEAAREEEKVPARQA